jgi:hypothetical protein
VAWAERQPALRKVDHRSPRPAFPSHAVGFPAWAVVDQCAALCVGRRRQGRQARWPPAGWRRRSTRELSHPPAHPRRGGAGSLAQRPRPDSIILMKRAGGSPSPLRCSAARAIRSANFGARCFPRPSIPSRTRPTVQATTTKITIIATTMEVTNIPFRQSMSSGTGKELPYRSYSRNCGAGGAGWNSSWATVCQTKITLLVLTS